MTASIAPGISRTVIVQATTVIAPEVTGTFSGTYTSTMTPTNGGPSFVGSFSITFNVVQSRSAISGTWSSSSGCQGPVSAQLSGNQLLNWAMVGNCVDFQGHPYTGSWSGSAIVSSDGKTIAATFNGSIPFHGFTDGHAVVTKP